MTKRPTIGILLDYETEGSFSSRPHYALRTVYFDAIWRAGGMPIGVPYVTDAIEDYLAACSGFLFPGGSYPFPSAVYGQVSEPGEALHPRYAFEKRLIAEIMDRDLPVLGICAGMQMIAAELGGTMYRSIADEAGTDFDHLNAQPAEQIAHGVTITKDTMLHRITGTEALDVNTAHNEALKTVPEGLIVNAIADDGIIEGVEVPGRRFCLGVEWHPEFFASPGDANFNLFKALVNAADGKDV